LQSREKGILAAVEKYFACSGSEHGGKLYFIAWENVRAYRDYVPVLSCNGLRPKENRNFGYHFLLDICILTLLLDRFDVR